MVKPEIRPRAKIKSATKEMIEKFEVVIGHPLPTEYAEFLKRNNGGVPRPDTFEYVSRKGKLKQSAIDIFFHLGKGSYSLEEVFKNSMKQHSIPKGYMPIALDTFGDYIGIVIVGSDSGKIKFCPTDLGLLEIGKDGYPTDNSLSEIAPNLKEFLGLFKEIDL